MDAYVEKELHEVIKKSTRQVEKAFNQELNYRILNGDKKSSTSTPKPLRGSKDK